MFLVKLKFYCAMTGFGGGCSSTNCFRIKPLVAITILFLIMALSEAGPTHRTRHDRKNIENFRKHDSFVPKNQTTELQLVQRQQNSLYKTETRKIKQKCGQVLRAFIENYKKINLAMKERTGNPSWLPKVNFVSIHSNTNSLSRNVKRRFLFMLPKVYKNLHHFALIFQRLYEIENIDCNVEYGRYSTNVHDKYHQRQQLLNGTINEINMIMDTINDAMIHLAYHPIHQSSSHIDLSLIKMEVDTTKCLQQDLVAYRSYEKTMKNWIGEFECWFPLKHKSREICIRYEERLKNRTKKRRNQA